MIRCLSGFIVTGYPILNELGIKFRRCPWRRQQRKPAIQRLQSDSRGLFAMKLAKPLSRDWD